MQLFHKHDNRQFWTPPRTRTHKHTSCTYVPSNSFKLYLSSIHGCLSESLLDFFAGSFLPNRGIFFLMWFTFTLTKWQYVFVLTPVQVRFQAVRILKFLKFRKSECGNDYMHLPHNKQGIILNTHCFRPLIKNTKLLSTCAVTHVPSANFFTDRENRGNALPEPRGADSVRCSTFAPSVADYLHHISWFEAEAAEGDSLLPSSVQSWGKRLTVKGNGYELIPQGTWGGRSIAPLILNRGCSWWWVVKFTPQPLYPRRPLN